MNIVQLPTNNLNDIPRMARQFADDVEAGQYGQVNAVVMAIDAEHGSTSFGWGEAGNQFKIIGMFQTAAHTHMSEMVGG
jgi:hypothetical protein